MTFIKGNISNVGIGLLSKCSTKSSECGCKDTSGASYQANSHQFNIVAGRKERAKNNN